MTIAQTIAKRTRDLLIEKGMSQYRLEQTMGIPHRTLLNITTAKHNSANIRTIFQICKGLGITMQEFFADQIFENSELDID